MKELGGLTFCNERKEELQAVRPYEMISLRSKSGHNLVHTDFVIDPDTHSAFSTVL